MPQDNKQINITLTETEAELLILGVIEIKNAWDNNTNSEMKKEHHAEISQCYQSIIEKLETGYGL